MTGCSICCTSKFKLGADASAAAGPVGRDAQASTDLTMRAQVLTYSRARGLFLGVSLSGGVIKQDDADTQAFYGKDWTYYSLLKGEVPAAEGSARSFLHMVEKYAPTPRPVATPTTAAYRLPAATANAGEFADSSRTGDGSDGASQLRCRTGGSPAAPATTTTPDGRPAASAPVPSGRQRLRPRRRLQQDAGGNH